MPERAWGLAYHHQGLKTAVNESQLRRPATATPQKKSSHLKRLRRVEGQVRGLQRMVESDEYWPPASPRSSTLAGIWGCDSAVPQYLGHHRKPVLGICLQGCGHPDRRARLIEPDVGRPGVGLLVAVRGDELVAAAPLPPAQRLIHRAGQVSRAVPPRGREWPPEPGCWRRSSPTPWTREP